MAQGGVIWLTGMPCSGKSTLARALADRLPAAQPCELLDGDVVRQNLSYGLGFSRQDRDANIKRIGFVANLLAQHGVTVIVATVSPYRQARDEVRAASERFLEVFVDASLELCERRDVKGMYAEARAGKRQNFTGVSDPYEAPLAPDVWLRTGEQNVDDCVSAILTALQRWA